MLKKLFGLFGSRERADRTQTTAVAQGKAVPIVSAEVLFRQAGEAFERDDTVQALDLYAQVVKLDPAFEKAHVMLGFLFKERGNLSKAKLHLSLAIELKEDLADAWYLIGNIAGIEKDLELMTRSYLRSLEISPQQEHIYLELSFALFQQKRVNESLDVLEKGLLYFPHHVGILQHLGNSYLYLFRYEEGLAAYVKALEQLPDSVELLNNYIVCCIVLSRFEEAFAGFARIDAIDPDCSQAKFLEALLCLKLGDFERGWKLFEWRWKTTGMSVGQFLSTKPKWDGTQDLEGKTILILSEQGYGDTIQFCRLVPKVAELGGKVVFVVLTALHDMMSQVQGVSQLLRETDILPHYDYYCELMSVPLALNLHSEAIPASSGYLESTIEKTAHWRAKISHQKRARRIGIVWAGNPAHTNNYLRSIPFDAIRQLFAIDADFTILQKDVSEEQIQELKSLGNVHFYGDEMLSFSDTAALVELMDLIVTVDTSVAHLAGAMGKETWVLISYHSDWRWLLDTDRSPWYDSVRLFRQKLGEPWAQTLASVKLELEK